MLYKIIMLTLALWVNNLIVMAEAGGAIRRFVGIADSFDSQAPELVSLTVKSNKIIGNSIVKSPNISEGIMKRYVIRPP